MKRIASMSASLIFASVVFYAAPALAQATRTWVSGVGDDANPCSRTAPCKTFAGAISKTAAHGEINTIDPGGFGAVTITKSITIDGGGGHTSSILASLVNGVIVNAGVNDVIQLRNIDINGVGNGLNGIRFLAGSTLIVENVKIFGFTQKGIDFEPAAASRLVVLRTTISDNQGASGGGILVQPGAAGSALVELVGVKTSLNTEGLRIRDRTNANVQDSVMNENSLGAIAQCATANCSLNLERSMVSSNLIGVRASGAFATVRLANVGIFGNTTGISPQGGAVISFGNNQVGGNGTDGAPTSTVPQQ
ncbi:MAG: right-handed parallel beta-helix repeat-containing protein [Methylocystis sp.]|uniref:right-handed parallel beta-helix repeat-containing protein n=1 Tax=Methylocystis sp. TaxID=1911079 RepID=UPI00395DCDF0